MNTSHITNNLRELHNILINNSKNVIVLLGIISLFRYSLEVVPTVILVMHLKNTKQTQFKRILLSRRCIYYKINNPQDPLDNSH